MEIKARLRSSDNVYVRINAAKLIGKSGNKVYFMDLIKSLNDTSPLVRIEVLKALGRINDHRAVNFLVNATKDYNEGVRKEVAKVLRKFPDTRSINALLHLLNDKMEEIIVESLYSLGVIGEKEVLKNIRVLIKHPSLKVKMVAFEVMSIIRSS